MSYVTIGDIEERKERKVMTQTCFCLDLMKNGRNAYCTKCDKWFVKGVQQGEGVLPTLKCPCMKSEWMSCTNDGNRTQECSCGMKIMVDGQLRVECP